MSELSGEHHPLINSVQVNLIGVVDYEVVRSVQRLGLKNLVSIKAHIPHIHAMEKMRSSQLLLLPVNRSKNSQGVIPGKFYEYIGAKRPILLLGPMEGDAAKILRQTKSGIAIDFDDSQAMIRALTDYYRRYLEEELAICSVDVENYSRQALGKQYCQLLDTLTEGRV